MATRFINPPGLSKGSYSHTAVVTGGRTVYVSGQVSVDETGKVVSTSIKKSSGNAELDKAAVNAVLKWKFKPAQKAGRNIRATCVVPFNFEVKKN